MCRAWRTNPTGSAGRRRLLFPRVPLDFDVDLILGEAFLIAAGSREGRLADVIDLALVPHLEYVNPSSEGDWLVPSRRTGHFLAGSSTVSRSHSLIVPSRLPEARVLPSP